MIEFKICSDLSHDVDHVFKHAFTLIMIYSQVAPVTKKTIRKAILAHMKDFGPEGQRWTYSAPDAWFVYIRFKDEADAMLYKLANT